MVPILNNNILITITVCKKTILKCAENKRVTYFKRVINPNFLHEIKE